jgi:hypothetical protein
MAKGHPMIPIFEGVLSIRIMSLVPLIKVGYYCNLLKQSFLSVCEISTGYWEIFVVTVKLHWHTIVHTHTLITYALFKIVTRYSKTCIKLPSVSCVIIM